MTKIREILRHSSLGLSQNAIAKSCSVSKSKVNLVLKRAKEMNLNISDALQMSDAELTQLLFPKDNPSITIVTYLIQTRQDRKYFVDDYNPDTFYDVMSEVTVPVYVKTYKRKNGDPAYNLQILREDEFVRGEHF